MLTSGPDSGRSWLMAVACCCVMLLVAVPVRLSGLLYVACLEHFDSQREIAAMPFIIFNVLKSILGPIVGYLGDVFGLRCVTVIGCLLATFGMALCYFAHDMIYIIVAIGLIYSTGFALSISLIPSIIKQHFVKYIANGCGIAYAGTCIAAFVFPSIFKYLWSVFGVSGAFLITAGIMLHSVPIAMLLKNPNYSKIETKKKQHGEQIVNKASPSPTAQSYDLHNVERSKNSEVNLEFDLDVKRTSVSEQCHNCTPPTEVGENPKPTEIRPNHVNFNYCNHVESVLETSKAADRTLCPDENALPIQTTKSNSFSRTSSNNHNFHHSNSKTGNSDKIGKHRKALKTLRIFYNPSFVVILITQSMLSYFMFYVWTLIIDISRDKSISEDLENYHLMLLSVTELVGYVALGWITDKKFMTKSNFSGFGFLAVSLSFAVMSCSTGFVSLIAAVGIFGVFSSALNTVYPGIVFEFIRKEDQNMALASRMTLHAPLSFTAAPIIGYFRGNSATGSYDNLMYFLSGLSCCCALLVALLPTVHKLFRNKSNFIN